MPLSTQMPKPANNPQPPDLTAVYQNMLLEKRAQVLSAMGVKFDTMAKMGRVAEEDQAQMSHDEFISLHLNSLDYVQLRLVNEALDRVSSGDYGICLACEQPIPPKRLQALPWARYCVPCQERVGAFQDPNGADSNLKKSVG
jgi:DnaK suppressor protein